MIFPTGLVDPDPAILTGSENVMENWSRSLEIFLRKLPDTNLVIATISHVLAPHWIRNPIIRLQRIPWKQRRLAEFFQIVQQLLFPWSFKTVPAISFGKPLNVIDLNLMGADLHEIIVKLAKIQLDEHRRRFIAIPKTGN